MMVLEKEELRAVKVRGCVGLCPSGTKCPCCSAPWEFNKRQECYKQMLCTCTSSTDTFHKHLGKYEPV